MSRTLLARLLCIRSHSRTAYQNCKYHGRTYRYPNFLCAVHQQVLYSPGSYFSTSNQLSKNHVQSLMEIMFQELLDLVNSKSVLLVDVREPKELIEDGRIPGSINVPLAEVEAALALSAEEFLSKYGRQLPSREESNTIVVSCRSGKRAAMALEKFKKQGYEDARCYSGSFGDWQANNGPIEKP